MECQSSIDSADAVQIIELLIERGADVNGRSDNCPLLTACRTGRAEIVRLLLNAGAIVRVNDGTFANTPLHVAALLHEEDGQAILKMLLDAGADVNARNERGESLLLVKV